VLSRDEPTAGVDVELRRDMWRLVRGLKEQGTTIILTTHYIEEAEEMADRVGVINRGEIILVEEKAALMRKLGRKELTVELSAPLAALPEALAPYRLALSAGGRFLTYSYGVDGAPPVPRLLADLSAAGIAFSDLRTAQSSLEDIFVSLVRPQP